MMMVLSVVGGIGGTFSIGVPRSWGRRHRAWILMLYSGTRAVFLGWFSFLFGISNTLQVANLANKPTGTKHAQWVELLLLQLTL